TAGACNPASEGAAMDYPPRHLGISQGAKRAHPVMPCEVASEPRRILQLIEPVEPHLFDDAVADDDEACLAIVGGVEMLMDGEGRYIDEVTALPSEALRLRHPVPFKGVDALEFQIPMQIMARPFCDKDQLLPHVPVLAGTLSRPQELHVGLYAAFLGVEAVV